YREERLAGRHPKLPVSQTQMLRWTASPAAAGNAIVVAPQDTSHSLGLDRQNGTILWNSADVLAPTLVGCSSGVAGFSGDTIVGSDGASGQIRWNYRASQGSRIAGPTVVRGGIAYIPTSRGITTLTIVDGLEVNNAPPVPTLQKVLTIDPAKK